MADARLIDANALKAKLNSLLKIEEAPPMFIEGLETALAMVDVATTIDAVPVVHGRWVHEQRYGDCGGWVWRCSECRREAISPIISALKYCHSCGAKMDGVMADG